MKTCCIQSVLTVILSSILVQRIKASADIPSDPCSNHTILNDLARYTSYTGSSPCLPRTIEGGWFSFGANDAGEMVTSCPKGNDCGTGNRIWINGSLPNSSDGVISLIACMKGASSCCSRSQTVSIKYCNGYYVYDIGHIPTCSTVCLRHVTSKTTETVRSPTSSTSTNPTRIRSIEVSSTKKADNTHTSCNIGVTSTNSNSPGNTATINTTINNKTNDSSPTIPNTYTDANNIVIKTTNTVSSSEASPISIGSTSAIEAPEVLTKTTRSNKIPVIAGVTSAGVVILIIAISVALGMRREVIQCRKHLETKATRGRTNDITIDESGSGDYDTIDDRMILRDLPGNQGNQTSVEMHHSPSESSPTTKAFDTQFTFDNYERLSDNQRDMVDHVYTRPESRRRLVDNNGITTTTTTGDMHLASASDDYERLSDSTRDMADHVYMRPESRKRLVDNDVIRSSDEWTEPDVAVNSG